MSDGSDSKPSALANNSSSQKRVKSDFLQMSIHDIRVKKVESVPLDESRSSKSRLKNGIAQGRNQEDSSLKNAQMWDNAFKQSRTSIVSKSSHSSGIMQYNSSKKF